MPTAPPAPDRKLWGGRTPEPETPSDAFAEAEIAVLAAEGRTDEAAEGHWMLFERTLDPAVLKAIIAGLEDFEDVVAVDRATAYARTYFDLPRALRFLMAWGALRDAAEVIVARADELNGRMEEAPLWASRLAAKWPEAAGLLLRARIKALRAMGARGVEVEVPHVLGARVAEPVDDQRRHAHERAGRHLQDLVLGAEAETTPDPARVQPGAAVVDHEGKVWGIVRRALDGSPGRFAVAPVPPR